jgi:hypothetical protein
MPPEYVLVVTVPDAQQELIVTVEKLPAMPPASTLLEGLVMLTFAVE